MSRVGQSKITIPEGVQVLQEGNILSAKGSKGELKIDVIILAKMFVAKVIST